jgi:hypothetical protein
MLFQATHRTPVGELFLVSDEHIQSAMRGLIRVFDVISKKVSIAMRLFISNRVLQWVLKSQRGT